MKTGQKIYYSPSLYEKAIPGKILDIQYFAGRPAWLTMQTKTGDIIADYESKFAASKPTPFEIVSEYANKYKNNFDGSIVTLRELRTSYEHYHADKISFDNYMKQLTENGCFVAIDQ